MIKQPIIRPPWRRVIVIGPGCEEEIRKIGKEARKLEGKILEEVVVNPELKNCQEYSIKQERTH